MGGEDGSGEEGAERAIQEWCRISYSWRPCFSLAPRPLTLAIGEPRGSVILSTVSGLSRELLSSLMLWRGGRVRPDRPKGVRIPDVIHTYSIQAGSGPDNITL